MHRTNFVPFSSFAAQSPPTGIRYSARGGRRRWCAVLCSLVLAFLTAGSLRAQEEQQVQPPPPAPTTGPLPTIMVTINGSDFRAMPTDKRIKEINVRNENIATVSVLPDLKTAVIVGRALGQTTVTLTDEDKKTDTFSVVVVLYNPELLKQVIAQVAPTGNIKIQPAQNGVVLSGTVDRAEEIPLIENAVRSVTGGFAGAGGGGGGVGGRGGIQIINAIRVGGVQQVQLDVVVAQVSRNELRNMNFNFLLSTQNFYLGQTLGNAVIQPTGVGLNQQLTIGNPTFGIPGGTTNVMTGVIHSGWTLLTFLQALRTEGVLKLMAEPRLVTMSGRPAYFNSGGQQAVPVASGLGTAGVNFVDFGTTLSFLPVVLGNGKIHLEVAPEVSSLDPASGTVANGVVVPGRASQRVQTTVELEAGQTFVIGGLIQRQVTGSTVKLPVLGDLPFVGTAFSSKTFNEVEQELLILVTPHLVDAEDCSQVPGCLPGLETRSPDDFELFLEGILEAPRGSRCVCPGKHYVPAWKSGPTAGQFPCGDACGNGACGNGVCGSGEGNCSNCSVAAPEMMTPAPKMTSATTAPAIPQTKATQGAPTSGSDKTSPADLPTTLVEPGKPALR